ncbi:MAG: hypothetical protein IJV74_05695, partial [Clostridia bacterium]|nr:hypothetical protein [Clostridia bacterium]
FKILAVNCTVPIHHGQSSLSLSQAFRGCFIKAVVSGIIVLSFVVLNTLIIEVNECILLLKLYV